MDLQLILSQGLNRDVSLALADTVALLFRKSESSAAFAAATLALGFSSEFSDSVHAQLLAIEPVTKKAAKRDVPQLVEEQEVAPVAKKKYTFKKIKKDAAQRLKEQPKSQGPTLQELAAKERLEKQEKVFEADLDNDTEWLAHEDAHSVIANESFAESSKFKNVEVQLTDAIVAHKTVPLFLRGQESHLSLEFSASQRVGPTISPVKDANSELAVMAKKGSFAVQERRERQERAKQARERVGQAEVVEEVADDSRDIIYTFAQIQDQRRRLPAYQCRRELMRTIAENQVVVVVGETGSGKTTQLTQFLKEEYDGVVGCTQPRRVAAVSVAKRVAEEAGVKLGDEVGYVIRFEDKTLPKTRIKYMTDGILLRELLSDPSLEKYSCLVMDEAHERTLSTDILLGLMKRLLRRRRDMRLVVTSATMDAARFSRFFGGAPLFTIPGRTFPVDVMYSAAPVDDYVESAAKQVMTVHLGSGPGDILVFATGQEDVEAICALVREKMAMLEAPPPLDVLPLYLSMPSEMQQRVFRAGPRRKVVVATNVAETSLTVDGVRFVVDTGLAKVKVYNPRLGMDSLQVVPVLLANAQQRSGRAGRTSKGTAFRLYTETATLPQHMHTQPVPEIQRANLLAVVLTLKALNVRDVVGFPFLDPPPADLTACSLYDLWVLGALGDAGELTPLGAQLARLPMDPTLAKLMVLAGEFRCLAQVATIVAMASVPRVFYRPRERVREADAAREKFLVLGLDHLTLVNVYSQWEQHARRPGTTAAGLALWCQKHFLHHKSLVRAREIRRQLAALVGRLHSGSDEQVRRCICAAYFHQLARLLKANVGEYASVRQPYMKMYIHPTSALAGDVSEYVVYDELVMTRKEYMQGATAVEAQWLLEYGERFYSRLQ